ncbi:4,5:9,10-diseco-3-hydroxy-5,9,17-trioxoandrosta-1(10),2-diene-4-oate hydrolase [Corynebacterium occultum]|uniref:4,5:9,10-diseco-3-hydroxy-5,9, 17-trioxoandrosta-1(10),2-diene-4-oate hydrolase n=1 Tax=Corynebacterium occultum TaxID=2675219 RepID=A0A6B8WPF0_9CORY|nr:alpha/beta hydrolase [Corynebacterium occultum]QGU08228.1 4,5:9,10-diseco-3-hydroxy-5,9,17-trioxoandrosta-1(10),2-diene-4-oate hydrolase [Corynebacterium occultum]
MTTIPEPCEPRSIWTYLNTVPHRLGWVEANQVSTRYLESGDPEGEVLLLLHGTAGSLENFCANYGPLGEHYRVIGIDMLGCGYTAKPDRPYLIADYAEHALACLDALGIEKAAVIGVSLGSWVGARMAHLEPGRITSLTMVAPAGIVVDVEKEKAVGADVRNRRQNAAQAPSWESVTTAMGRLMLNPADLIDDLVSVRLRIYQQPEMATAMGNLLAFTRGDQHLSLEEWQELTLPVLVIAAVEAPNMFLDNAYALAEVLPRPTLVELSGCDHWAQFEQPEAFHRAALDFLSSVSAGAAVNVVEERV